MTLTTAYPLMIATADNTAITCDSIEFTTDGACLVNGGGALIIEPIPEPYALGDTHAGIRRW